jgi:hypothetical protein
MIRGQNLLKEIDGVRQWFGFYTNVFIEAFTPADAESRAIDTLHEDAHLGLNAVDDPVRSWRNALQQPSHRAQAATERPRGRVAEALGRIVPWLSAEHFLSTRWRGK